MTYKSLNCKRLHPEAVIPTYAKPGDAGMDLTAINIISETDDQITYGTGLAVEIPEKHVGLIFPRSSVRKYNLQLSNSVGVVDSGYRGEIQFTFNKLKGAQSVCYQPGDRIGQLIVLPFPPIWFTAVEELSSTERGEGGFGSTGK